MADDFNMNSTAAENSGDMNDFPVMSSMPVEGGQASSPSLVDFSAPINSHGSMSSSGGAVTGSENIDMLMDVNLQFTVELGRTMMPVRQILELQNGSVVELDRIAGEAVDVYINEHLMARGEVVVVDDKFGVRITELISPTKGK